MKREPLNDVEWPKDEDYVPERDEYSEGTDEAYDEAEERDRLGWDDDDDDYGPDDDGEEGAAAF